MKCKVMIARFPGNNHEDPDCVSWLMKTYKEMLFDPRIADVHCFVKSDTPIDMVRNQCVQNAMDLGIDYLLMIDNDMKPDYARANRPFAPFWKSSFDWMWRREAPSIIAAPYVGPDPHNNIYVFRADNLTNDLDDPGNYVLRQFQRQEAAERGGIEKVKALPTGLILIDMRVFENRRLQIPWFDYEREGDGARCNTCRQHKRGKWLGKASTEDVYFSRNVDTAWHQTPGAGCYVNWDSWAIHIKRTYCYPPELLYADQLGVQEDRAREPQYLSNQQIRIVGAGETPRQFPKNGERIFVDLVNPVDPANPWPEEFRQEDPNPPSADFCDQDPARNEVPGTDGRLVHIDAEQFGARVLEQFREFAPKGASHDLSI